jgi:hypothetical protein
MSVNLTDSQEIWVDQCVRTGWRIYMRGLLTRINQRPENKNIPTFSDVEWKREANQMLHELAKDVHEVKETTKKSGNILKSIVSIFKVAGEEAKRH